MFGILSGGIFILNKKVTYGDFCFFIHLERALVLEFSLQAQNVFRKDLQVSLAIVVHKILERLAISIVLA